LLTVLKISSEISIQSTGSRIMKIMAHKVFEITEKFKNYRIVKKYLKGKGKLRFLKTELAFKDEMEVF